MLLAMGIVGETRTVHFRREGMVLALSLPYFVGIGVIFGPFWAVIAEVIAVAIAAVIRSKGKLSPKDRFWLGLNLPVVAIAHVLGGCSYLTTIAAGGHWVLGLTAYIVTYLIANAILVAHFNVRLGAKRFTHQALAGLRGVWLVAGLYVLVALAVGVFLRADVPFLVPLTFVPIELIRQIVSAHKRMDDHGYETIVAMTIMLQRAHPYTHGHLERVGRIAETVGKMLGLPPARTYLLREAAVLHDIGKIAIDEEVLDKPAKLTEAEYEHVKLHSEFGATILSRSERFHPLVTWIRHHHERPDGRGYPHQLTDVEIPLESKIIAVADAFDAMVGGSNSSERRNYREPLPQEDALAELERCAGTQFDPKVVAAFRSVLEGRAG